MISLQRYDQALTEISKALALPPHRWIDCHFTRGLALLRLGRIEEARQEMHRALLHGPFDSEVALYLAMCHEVAGADAEARSIYEGVVSRGSGLGQKFAADWLAILQSKKNDANWEFELAIELNDNLLNGVAGMFRNEITPEALFASCTEKAALTKSHYYAGRYYDAIGQHDDALNYYRLCWTERHRDLPESDFAKAILSQREKEVAQAK